jgi:hypothetical protein
MKDEQRIKALEEAVNVLKNEIKMVLLDLREQYLNVQNPFNYVAVPGAGSEQTANQVAEKEIAQTPPEEEKVEEKIETPATTSLPDVKTGGGQKHGELQQPPLPPPPPQPINDNVRLWQGTELRDEEEEFDREPPRRELAFSQGRRKQEQDFYHGDSKVDLVVIAGLTQWIDQATAKLGKERTEILIEMFFAMGRLPEKLKDTLVRMIHVSHHESQGQSITASDYLALLAQLENLLANSNQQDKALLSILSMMKDSKDG